MRLPFLTLWAFAGLLLAGPTLADESDAPSPVEVERREHGALILENIPPLPASDRAAIQPYLSIRSAVLADWAPEEIGGGLLVATRFGETAQLHHVLEPMGMRRQVTFHPEPVSSGAFARTGDPHRILISMDDAGSERSQVFLHDLRTGRAEMITDGESVNRGAIWANNSPTIAFTSTARNGTDWDIYTLRTDEPDAEPVRLTEEEGMWFPLDWSPDDSRLLVLHYISINESRLFTLPVEEPELKLVNERANGPVSYRNARFSRNGEGIFFTSDEGSEFQRLRYYDLRHQTSQTLVDDIPWDVSTMDLSPDGRLVAFVTNEDGLSKLYLLNTRTLAREAVTVPQGIIHSVRFHDDSEQFAISLHRASSPGDVYTTNVWGSKEWTRWTASEVGGLPEETFIEPSLFSYRTFDDAPDGTRRRIPAWIYRPRSEGPHPVLVDIHGGPEAQARPFFNSLRQYLLNEMGIAVIVPNVRGSSGYGKTYLTLDNAKKREDAVRDIGALLEWIETQPDLDESRVALYGWSYGGYMVLASMAMFPERIAGGINGVGISNFVTFLENTSDYRRNQRRQEYGDERDPEMRAFLESISPTNNADRITSPLLVVHGYNDPRVPVSEAEQIVEAVRANGVDVWYFLAMNEGHGLRRKENNDAFREAAVMFLRKTLFDGERPERPPLPEPPVEAPGDEEEESEPDAEPEEETDANDEDASEPEEN